MTTSVETFQVDEKAVVVLIPSRQGKRADNLCIAITSTITNPYKYGIRVCSNFVFLLILKRRHLSKACKKLIVKVIRKI